MKLINNILTERAFKLSERCIILYAINSGGKIEQTIEQLAGVMNMGESTVQRALQRLGTMHVMNRTHSGYTLQSASDWRLYSRN